MRNRTAWLVVWLSLLGSVAWTAPPDAPERSTTLLILDPGRVYFGRARHLPTSRECAVVELSRVYDHVPEVRRIRREQWGPSDPEYHFLVARASRTFRHALGRVARDHGFDLVAERGAIRGGSFPDITKLVIREISKRGKDSRFKKTDRGLFALAKAA